MRALLRSGVASGWLPRAESLERLECGGLIRDVLECPCCALNLSECYSSALDAVAREPPQCGALEPIRLGTVDDDADRKRVAQVDLRQLARGAANDRHVACLQGSSKAGVCRSLTHYEHMFACAASRAFAAGATSRRNNSGYSQVVGGERTDKEEA